MATITLNGDTATFRCDPSEQRDLRKLFEQDEDAFGCDEQMRDAFEDLFANSELLWLSSDQTGDLTAAPMFGVADEQEKYEGLETKCDGYIYWGSEDRSKILWRWAFMDYAVRTPLQDLMEKGEAVFTGGDLRAGSPHPLYSRGFTMRWP